MWMSKSKEYIERNFLCFKDKKDFDSVDKSMFKAYRTPLLRLYHLSTVEDAQIGGIDAIRSYHNGLTDAPKVIQGYYHAFLNVSSYFQSSKGGRGKVIEKTIASQYTNCIVGVDFMSGLPLLLKDASLLKDKEKEKDSKSEIDIKYVGEKNLTFDLVSFFSDEGRIVILELKNRVDSGGTAARVEAWGKFTKLFNCLQSSEPLYSDSKGEHLTMIDVLKQFKISKVESAFGLLFDKETQQPADINSDKQGFISTSKREYKILKNLMQKADSQSSYFLDELLTASIHIDKIKFSVQQIYGDQCISFITGKEKKISDLFEKKDRYDDLRVAQLVTIVEREALLTRKRNASLIVKEILENDADFSLLLDKYVQSGGELQILEKIITLLQTGYSDKIEEISELYSRILHVRRDYTDINYMIDAVQLYALFKAVSKKK